MLRERISEDVYVFTSEVYAQVTAGAVVSPDGAAVIDTLAFPSETLEILDFVQNRIGVPVRYVINTHYHADHTYGTCLFTGAEVIAHAECRRLLDTTGRAGLKSAKSQTPDLAHIEIILPETIMTQGPLFLHLGKKTLELNCSPGHSPDLITVLVREDRILFASDTVMPVPHVVDGSLDDLRHSLEIIPSLGLENIVQGHGEIILRGEIDEAIKSNIRYLDAVRRKAEAAVKRGKPRDTMRAIEIEDCGKSRILLGGLAAQLHTANLFALYDRMTA
ncbi:MAG: MBL fold metallo-hydrolase [Chloroflexi bacterium]|nr:MBL fold metallo-hydrolase [Chloroflexota bacterium]MBI3761776.1 MBL fold metallo-hydrolase [Chloroflexota bacterium]